jgi:hypothetical protein
VTIKNTVAFAETITNGLGVTLSGQTVIPPNSVGRFLVTVTAVGTPAVSMQGLAVSPISTSVPLAATSLSSIGAGTITAAGIAGGLVQRSGSQSNTNFADTTDSVTNIFGAVPNASVGQSWLFVYENQTNAAATIGGAASVTVSGITVVPPGTWVGYLVTLATSSTVTMVGFQAGPNVAQQPPTRTTSSPTNATNTLSSGVLSDLTLELTAGQKVTGIFHIFANNSTAGEGLKFDLNGGSASFTSIEFGFAGTPTGATVTGATSTAIGTALTCSTVSTSDACYSIFFSGVVNNAGTLVPRFAENSTHSTGTATAELNSSAILFTTAN